MPKRTPTIAAGAAGAARTYKTQSWNAKFEDWVNRNRREVHLAGTHLVSWLGAQTGGHQMSEAAH
ncbi:hypothetical protein CHLRE_06g249450v5 [Chlamydomonas reinhardtii]|uniref:Uncharacterized protein n=1 Tax=Chlamydomonas reinhardtii TaxID=3055 RepID=A0A2K3DLU1_CHLRE|nr:uncharacterized protein CHLRE_06g249450v5 [Chlamydomonas reinhardtii]PNW81504.1 hypothetical protein CHLRE_06g249450v5 [Chlamydomonas reinhardtii]